MSIWSKMNNVTIKNFKSIEPLNCNMKRRGEVSLLSKNISLLNISESLMSIHDPNKLEYCKDKLLRFSKKVKAESIIAILCSPVSQEGYLLMRKSEYNQIKKKEEPKGYPKINRSIYYDLNWFNHKRKLLKKR